MRRRILLLVVSFTAILVIFGLYLLLGSWSDGKAVTKKTASRQGAAKATSAPNAGTFEPTEGTDFRATRRDKQGRLETIVQSPRYDKQSDGTYLLQHPSCIRFQPGGQQLIVKADEGVIRAESIRADQGGGKFIVRRGKLRGNVRIYYDPFTGADRAPVETRIEEVVVITAEDLEFDDESLLLFTNNRVTVDSPQVALRGRGLSIRWNEDPQELRSLRLEHGEYMEIKETSQEAGLFSLPGSVAPSPALASKPAASVPASKGADSDVLSIPGRKASSRKGQNIYRAQIIGEVRVDQGNRYVHDADELFLEFQWGREVEKEAASSPSSRPTTATGPTSRPASEPAVIKWSGPLVITPAGYTDAPSRRNITVGGKGRNVVLNDEQAKANCIEFSFNRGRDEGFLKGTADQPAVLKLSSGETAVCETMRFDLTGGTANLLGPGSLTRPSQQVISLGGGKEAAATAPTGTETIRWSKSVLALIERGRETVSAGKTLRTNANIKEATFEGQVDLAQSDSGDNMRCDKLHVWMGVEGGKQFLKTAVAEGEVQARQKDQDIKADRLEVQFRQVASYKATGEKNRLRTEVKTLLAWGDVMVSGTDGSLNDWTAWADKLQADPNAQTAVLYGSADQFARVDQGGQGISGQEIHLDQAAGVAQSIGAGKLRMSVDKDLSGQKLATSRPAEVTWAKSMRYEDRPAGSDGNHPIAHFTGDVQFATGLEWMSCREMKVLFDKTAKLEQAKTVAQQAPAPATAPTTRKARSSLAMGGKGLGGGALSKIYANDQVVLRSRRMDDQGRLIGLAELNGDTLIYDAANKTAESAGPGRLIVQDLRPPKPKTDANSKAGAAMTVAGSASLQGQTDDQIAQELGRPSQTYFEWSSKMRLSMKNDDRRVTMSGEVWMQRLEGAKIVRREELQQNLNIPPWPEKLPEGRASDLICDNLVAIFAEPNATDANSKAKPAGDQMDTGLKLAGSMKKFIATGSVLLVDDPWEVTGESLVFDRRGMDDVFTVLGNLEGQPTADARLVRRNPDSVTASSWIEMIRKRALGPGGKVEVHTEIRTGPMGGSGVINPTPKKK